MIFAQLINGIDQRPIKPSGRVAAEGPAEFKLKKKTVFLMERPS